MFPVATNSIAVEILTADRRYQHGLHTHRFRLINVFAQVLLIGAKGCRATVVHGLSVAQLLVQRVLFVAICAVRFLIVVRKLNQQNIAGCHRIRPAGLQGCPIGSLSIKGFATCARLAAVVHRNLRLIEELLEHLPPASFVGTLVIGLHRRVAYAMQLLRRYLNTCPSQQHRQQERHPRKEILLVPHGI